MIIRIPNMMLKFVTDGSSISFPESHLPAINNLCVVFYRNRYSVFKFCNPGHEALNVGIHRFYNGDVEIYCFPTKDTISPKTLGIFQLDPLPRIT